MLERAITSAFQPLHGSLLYAREVASNLAWSAWIISVKVRHTCRGIESNPFAFNKQNISSAVTRAWILSHFCFPNLIDLALPFVFHFIDEFGSNLISSAFIFYLSRLIWRQSHKSSSTVSTPKNSHAAGFKPSRKNPFHQNSHWHAGYGSSKRHGIIFWIARLNDLKSSNTYCLFFIK